VTHDAEGGGGGRKTQEATGVGPPRQPREPKRLEAGRRPRGANRNGLLWTRSRAASSGPASLRHHS
jgi:hypothetical protein